MDEEINNWAIIITQYMSNQTYIKKYNNKPTHSKSSIDVDDLRPDIGLTGVVDEAREVTEFFGVENEIGRELKEARATQQIRTNCLCTLSRGLRHGLRETSICFIWSIYHLAHVFNNKTSLRA